VGIGLRRAHFAALERSDRSVDFFEITPEVFLGCGGRTRRALDVARERAPIVPHGVSLSLGGPDPLDPARLDALAGLCDGLDAPYYSDHVCLASIGGVQTFDLLPLPFCEEAAEHVAARARVASEAIGRPLALENIATYARMPGSTWDEGRFLHEVLARASAGLLLDVSNVVVNAQNLGIDPRRALDALPLERTVQIHLAGHRYSPSRRRVIDDHASAPSTASLALYQHALERIGRSVPTLIEWDQSLPSLDDLLDVADDVRAIAEHAAEARVA
jgi:uncharacterized protein (UPF0276 family)